MRILRHSMMTDPRRSSLQSMLSKWRKQVLAILLLLNIALAVYSLPMILCSPPSSHHGNTYSLRALQEFDEESQLVGSSFRTVIIDRTIHVIINKTEPQESNTRNSVDERKLLEPFHHVLKPWSVSCDSGTFLHIVVNSAFQNVELRQAIRETWGGYSRTHPSVSLLFLLGSPSPSVEHLVEHVQNESSTYGDILQESYMDHYANLSIKSLSMLRWAWKNCSQAKFVMKTDDDIFINMQVLLTILSKQISNGRRDFVLGYVIKNARPIANRFSKWYTPSSLFPSKTYPNYLSGTAYVISGSLIPRMCTVAMEIKFFWLEDVYITGMLAHKAGAVFLHSEQFGYHKRRRDPCLYQQIVTAHEVTALEMRNLWTELHKSGLLCSQGNSLHLQKVS